MSGTATHQILDEYVLHRMDVILCQGLYVVMVNLMNGKNYCTSSISERMSFNDFPHIKKYII